MAAQTNAAPVIIKRKKVVSGGGHHGGAWKVAYADFVTAMMAFFMLMWLLNATTEKQRKGIADYFSPTIPLSRVSGGGDGSFGGDNVMSEDQIAQNGIGAQQTWPTEQHQAAGETGTQSGADAAAARAFDVGLTRVQAALNAIGGESMVSEDLARHIVTRVTDEGLIIEIFDLEGEPLFEGDSDRPRPVTKALATMFTGVFDLVDAGIAINGHTRAYPEVMRVNPTWNLSASRATAMRVLLEGAGTDPQRIRRVAGFADRKQAVSNPMALRNNRIEIILLRPGRM